MKKIISTFLGFVLLMSISGAAFAESDAARRGIDAIMNTRYPDLIVLPEEESYLEEWTTGYARKAF